MIGTQFLRLTSLAVLLAATPTLADDGIRIMAANTSSGNNQSYDPGHGNRIFQGLRPDIALVQEMSYLNNTPSDIRAWVDENFGREFFFPGKWGRDSQWHCETLSHY